MPEEEIKMVTIRKKYLEELEDDSLLLQCLNGGGVDNWTWYGEAYQEFLQLKEEES